MPLPSPSGPRRRGLVIALAVSAAAVAAGVVIGVVLAPRFGAGSGSPSTSTSASRSTVASPSGSPSGPESPTGTQTPDLPALPSSAALPDDQFVVPMLVGGTWDLYLAQAGADKPVRPLVEGAGNDSFPILSQDRRTMIFVHWQDNVRSLRVAAVDGSGARQLFRGVSTACALRVTRPAWHPTEPDVLAVPCINASRKYGLYLMRTDGSLIRSIDLGGRKVGDPTWTADGSKLAFWATGATSTLDGGAIYVADGDGRNAKAVSTGKPGVDADPAFSPDGAALVFRHRVSATRMDLYSVPTDGSAKPKLLLKSAGRATDPSFSPDGTKIAFNNSAAYGGRPALTRVWVMNRDGSAAKPIWTAAPSVGREQSTAAWTRR